MLILLNLVFRVICFVSALLRANGGVLCQFLNLAKRLCIKKEANVPEDKARDVPIEEIEDAFSDDKPERSRSRRSSKLQQLDIVTVPIEEIEEAFSDKPERSRSRRSSKLQLDIVKKLEENSSSVSAGRMAAADKSFF